jgi:hypothetical protein
MYKNDGEEKDDRTKQFFEVSTTFLLIVFFVFIFIKFLYF